MYISKKLHCSHVEVSTHCIHWFCQTPKHTTLRVFDCMSTNCAHWLTLSSDHRPSLVILHVLSGTSSLISIGYGSGNSKNVGIICTEYILQYVCYACWRVQLTLVVSWKHLHTWTTYYKKGIINWERCVRAYVRMYIELVSAAHF